MWTSVGFSIPSPWLSVCDSHRLPLVLVSLNDESLLWLTFHAPDISSFFCGIHCNFCPIDRSLFQRIYAGNLTLLHIVCPRRLSFGIWVKASMALYLLRSVSMKQNHRSEVVLYHQLSNKWEHWSQGCCGLYAPRDCRLRGKTCVVRACQPLSLFSRLFFKSVNASMVLYLLHLTNHSFFSTNFTLATVSLHLLGTFLNSWCWQCYLCHSSNVGMMPRNLSTKLTNPSPFKSSARKVSVHGQITDLVFQVNNMNDPRSFPLQ